MRVSTVEDQECWNPSKPSLPPIIIPMVWYWNVILHFIMCITAYPGKVPGRNESFDCRRSGVLESIETFSHPSTMAGVKSEQHMALIMQKTCQICLIITTLSFNHTMLSFISILFILSFLFLTCRIADEDSLVKTS